MFFLDLIFSNKQKSNDICPGAKASLGLGASKPFRNSFRVGFQKKTNRFYVGTVDGSEIPNNHLWMYKTL